MGSCNSIKPGGGSNGNKRMVKIRVINIKSIAITARNASVGFRNMLIKRKSDINQIMEKVKMERSLAGNISITGS